MESEGVRLKKVRLEKGISLEEAHKKTKIHLNILKALEEDGLMNIKPIYIKGFLKIYCKFLGIDPHDYIPDYREPGNLVMPVSKPEEKPISALLSPSIKLFSLRVKRIGIKIVFTALVIILVSMGLFNLSKRAKPSKALFSKTEKKSETKELKVAGITGNIRLGIRANEDCWIQLKSDGRVIFQNILKKGRFESWQAKEKIELSLGNAGAVDLEVNGKLISKLGKRGQVIKNILITKEGLIVGR